MFIACIRTCYADVTDVVFVNGETYRCARSRRRRSDVWETRRCRQPARKTATHRPRYDAVLLPLRACLCAKLNKHACHKNSASVRVYVRGGLKRSEGETRIRVLVLSIWRTLRSAGTNRLLVPTVRLSTVGNRAFPVAGPRVWNTRPEDITTSQSLSTFCQRLKTWLFRKSYPDIII